MTAMAQMLTLDVTARSRACTASRPGTALRSYALDAEAVRSAGSREHAVVGARGSQWALDHIESHVRLEALHLGNFRKPEAGHT